MIDPDHTLDDDLWKDSFDRLLNKRTELRELNVLKKNVRISFNNDSSVEASREILFQEDKQAKNPLHRRISGSISTPKLYAKAHGPFDCTISPISSWRLTNAPQKDPFNSTSCVLKSYISDSAPETIDENECLVISSKKSSLRNTNCIPIMEINGGEIEDSDSNSPTANVTNDQGPESELNINLLLPPGKWRKSLTVWKRLHQPKYECLDSSEGSNTNQFTLNIRNSRKTIFIGRKTKSAKISPKRKSELELLKICKQTEVLPFSIVYSNSGLRKCRKIGEGTYGEVFLNLDENEEQTVIKIIPIEGDGLINGEPQKTFETILPEVLITSELSKLRVTKAYATSRFVFLKNTRYFRGKYPDYLIELWDFYEQTYGSENDHPEVFKDGQLYVSLEIAFGGKDLEGYVFRNSEQAYSAFLQIALSLAVGEKILQFEHRDLHVGNILIQETKEKNIEFIIDKKTISIPTNGIQVTIIDYTLSRMSLNKCTFYNDLSTDEELFCAKGDYQYDIYRLMKERLNNDWEKYEPYTNILWLHYILTKLIDSSKYKNSKSKVHKQFLERLKNVKDEVLSSDSAYDFISSLKI